MGKIKFQHSLIYSIYNYRVLYGEASYYISIWESVLHSILQFNQEKQVGIFTYLFGLCIDVTLTLL